MMRTAFLCTVQSAPTTLPSAVTALPACELSPKLMFVAAHRIGQPYAMTIGRLAPVFPTANGGSHVLSVVNIDLYLVWDGIARCRVPVISTVNTAYGWVVVLDAPRAVGVKTPDFAGAALTPEAPPWNAWPSTEKRGKDIGDEQPHPEWLMSLDAMELLDAVAVAKEALRRWKENAPPPLPPLKSPTERAAVQPAKDVPVPEDIELPFDFEPCPPSGVRPASPNPDPPKPPLPQLALF